MVLVRETTNVLYIEQLIDKLFLIVYNVSYNMQFLFGVVI